MRSSTASGRNVAALLAGAWRTSPPAYAPPADLAEVLPLLQETGAGSLAYWRLYRSGLHHSGPARQLKQVYQLHALEAAIRQEHLQELVLRLRCLGVEPLLIKGWSVSRLYPEPGLRPYGDFDICVRPREFSRAAALLSAVGGACGWVDLHAGVADLNDRSLDELYNRSRLLRLGGVDVRCLGAEDQLRHLCLHMMRHGAWRPLWLCDLGAALESMPADFNWDYCLSGDRLLNDWVVGALGLACRLLDARVEPAGIAPRLSALPCWLAPSLLRIWSRGARSSDAVVEPIARCPPTWAAFSAALRRRWPNAIRAAFKLRLSPFSRLPRPMIQLAAFYVRAQQYALERITAGDREVHPRPFDVHPAEVR